MRVYHDFFLLSGSETLLTSPQILRQIIMPWSSNNVYLLYLFCFICFFAVFVNPQSTVSKKLIIDVFVLLF